MTDRNKSIVNRHRFTAHEVRLLEANPNVLNVTENTITYAPEFKLAAVNANREGKSPQQIFTEAGFQLSIIGRDKPKECLKRWRVAYSEYGEEGLLNERRGKIKTRRNSSQNLSVEEQLKRAEARIKLLEIENDFLKKLEALERQVKADRT